MKTASRFILFGSSLFGAILLASPPVTPSSDSLKLSDLTQYIRITQQPFKMHDSTAILCAPSAVKKATTPHEPDYPESAFCNVYVNSLAKETMLSGDGIYPVGSIVIKSKLTKRDSQEPELFTVMEKMENGYDAEHGNWKYIVADGKTFKQIATGRIDSCIECHTQYKETDYITREYMTDP